MSHFEHQVTDELHGFSCVFFFFFLTLQVKGADNAYMELFATFKTLEIFLNVNSHTLIKPEMYVP